MKIILESSNPVRFKFFNAQINKCKHDDWIEEKTLLKILIHRRNQQYILVVSIAAKHNQRKSSNFMKQQFPVQI